MWWGLFMCVWKSKNSSRWEDSITGCWQDIYIISLHNDSHSAYINVLLFKITLQPFMISIELCCFCVLFGVCREFAGSQCHVVWLVCPCIFLWLILCPLSPHPSSLPLGFLFFCRRGHKQKRRRERGFREACWCRAAERPLLIMWAPSF